MKLSECTPVFEQINASKEQMAHFSREKKNFAVRRNETSNLDFCHSVILGHWFSGLKKKQPG